MLERLLNKEEGGRGMGAGGWLQREKPDVLPWMSGSD